MQFIKPELYCWVMLLHLLLVQLTNWCKLARKHFCGHCGKQGVEDIAFHIFETFKECETNVMKLNILD